VNGWGRVDVLNSLRPEGGRAIWYTDATTGVGTGGEMTFNLTVGTGTAPEQAPAAGLNERLPGTTLDEPAPRGDEPLLEGLALLDDLREGGASTTAEAAPVLHIGSATAEGGSVTLPVSLDSGGTSVSSVAFSIDYDETRLAFDPTDANGDGVPDALRLTTPDGFDLSATVDVSRAEGEIALFIGDLTPALAALPDGALLTLTFDLIGAPSGTAAVRVAAAPAVSFGTPTGTSVAGSGTNGAVRLSAGSTTLYLPLVSR
jgi:hypothetical protein